MTPFKLLQRPSTHINKTSLSLPMRQDFIPKSKTPKLFSSMRAPSVQSRPRTQKTQSPNLPSFLTEYLSDPLNKSKPSTRKTLTQSKLFRKKNLKEEKKTQKIVLLSPKPNQFEILDSRKILSGSLYKPYVLKISPRAKIRLYSPSPIGLSSGSHGDGKKRTRKSEFYTTGDNEGKKDYEIQAIKVHVDSYSKDYAEKLRKVLEIKEQARMEVERI
jgi:hypothetical protein